MATAIRWMMRLIRTVLMLAVGFLLIHMALFQGRPVDRTAMLFVTLGGMIIYVECWLWWHWWRPPNGA